MLKYFELCVKIKACVKFGAMKNEYQSRNCNVIPLIIINTYRNGSCKLQ